MAYTVVDPRTVVVHLHTATITSKHEKKFTQMDGQTEIDILLAAVVGSWGLISFTDIAVLQKTSVFHNTRLPLERYVPSTASTHRQEVVQDK